MGNVVYEKQTIEKMINLYCQKRHRSKVLCAECELLKQYALNRLSKCPFGDDKGACSDCKVHCYKSEMRDKIRAVMRFSGLRMLFYHPTDFLKHIIKKRL